MLFVRYSYGVGAGSENPFGLRYNHGTEFTSNAILAWLKEHKVEWHDVVGREK